MRSPNGPLARLSAIASLVLVLAGLFVLYGAGWSGFGLESLVTATPATATNAATAGVSPDGSTLVASLEWMLAEPTPWAEQYKYAISAVAVVWVGVRTLDCWRFMPRRLVAEPRPVPLSSRLARSTPIRRLFDETPVPPRSTRGRQSPPADRRSLDHD